VPAAGGRAGLTGLVPLTYRGRGPVTAVFACPRRAAGRAAAAAQRGLSMAAVLPGRPGPDPWRAVGPPCAVDRGNGV